MPNVVIQNPILNSPFSEPTSQFRFDEEGITDIVVEGRRDSEYFMPVPASRKRKGAQLAFDTEWRQNRVEKNAVTAARTRSEHHILAYTGRNASQNRVYKLECTLWFPT